METSAIGLILHAGIIVKGVILILLFFSVVSWAIIFYKWKYFKRAAKENEIFLRNFSEKKDAKSLNQSARMLFIGPIANLFRSVYAEGVDSRDRVKRSLKRFLLLESSKLERHLNFLATTGSTTPFIGLFGTVWGIINAFRSIGIAGSASLAVVAPGIAEALITTAAGLVAAIPAVIGYNYYLSTARRLIIETQDFTEELLDYFSEG
ncbi:biopolymer transport protein ExbB [bacterium BMS3Abin07]|nr:biopolymer transport protein ExbB [bacterium BMS3Abin07]GBE32363.1 biopolymer transport protein ExbB [bacterium BMS3Bbin05]